MQANQHRSNMNGCCGQPIPVTCLPCCPESQTCGEYNFSAPATLHYITHVGVYTVYEVLADGTLCKSGGLVANAGENPCDRTTHLYPDAGEYVIQWCICPNSTPPEFWTTPADSTLPPPYQQDAYGSEADPSDLVTNSDGSVTWTPPFSAFRNYSIRIGSCCTLIMTHSGTPNGGIRLEGGRYGRQYSASFDSDITNLQITAKDPECLKKCYIQVSRG